MLKKIVILGPESTGKSTLCESLARHYGTSWCPEFAREYLLKYGMNYSFDDLLTIAKGQITLEEKHLSSAAPGSKYLFIDTDMYVLKVWCEFVFGKCHPWILKQIAERQYDLYLLSNTDLPWVKDELREYPDPAIRNRLLLVYKEHMINQGTPWADIYGNHEERLASAIGVIGKYFD